MNTLYLKITNSFQVSEVIKGFNLEPMGAVIPPGTHWVDRNGVKCRVIDSDLISVRVNRDIQFQYSSGKRGSAAWGEFTLRFFLYAFTYIDNVKENS